MKVIRHLFSHFNNRSTVVINTTIHSCWR